jgi:hypothetical protein
MSTYFVDSLSMPSVEYYLMCFQQEHGWNIIATATFVVSINKQKDTTRKII